MPTVLVVDDQRAARRVLASRLESAGFHVLQAADGLQAWDAFQEHEPQLVITDMSMPRSDGIELAGRIRECSDVPVIVFSAYGSVPTAVSALKAGANDFISSADLDVDALVQLARNLCTAPGQRSELSGLEERLPGSSSAIVRARKRIAALAPLRTPVLLVGEPGTGRTTAARALHDFGATAGLDFYKFDAARLTSSTPVPERGLVLVRGVEQLSRGAQAFWADHLGGGSEGQPLRIVASSSVPLAEWRQSQSLQADLVEALLQFPVELPPLRHRADDIPRLAAVLLERIGRKLGKHPPRFTPDAAKLLSKQSWPGNLHQLKGFLHRTVAFSAESEIPASLVAELVQQESESLAGVRDEAHQRQREDLIVALRATEGNISRTAERLGLSRQAVYRLMEKFEITTEPDASE